MTGSGTPKFEILTDMRKMIEQSINQVKTAISAYLGHALAPATDCCAAALARATKSRTAPMTEAGSALPSRPMLAARSRGSAPCWIRQETTTQASASSASRVEPLRRPWGEHLARSSIRIEADRDGEALPAVFELNYLCGAAIGEPDPRHRTPPCVSIAHSRMASASASLSSAGWNPRARTAAITAALSALPLPVTCRLIAPTGTPWYAMSW